jgi:dipeptidyl-peptidase 4
MLWVLIWLGSWFASSCSPKEPPPAPPPEKSSEAKLEESVRTWPMLDEKFLEAAAATLNFRLGKPQPLAITRDGSVLYRRSGARDRRSDLYELTPTGEEKRLTGAEDLAIGADEKLSAAERARRERTRTVTAGIVDIDVSDDGERVLVPLGERVFVLERSSGKSHEVPLGEGVAFDPHLSPDGKLISFVRDGDLWLVQVDGGKPPRRLTQHPPSIEYGVAEFVSQEEFDRPRGYFWSADSQFIAFQRTDASKVTTVYVSDPVHPERVPDEFKYPRAGSDNAVVDLGIISVKGGQPRWVQWDLQRYPYLARVDWAKRGPLTLTVLDRAQTQLALLAVEPSGAVRELLQATDAAWVKLVPGSPAWLDDGSGFLWLAESEPGFAVELRDAKGAVVREVLPATFGARAIAGVAPDGSGAIVIASKDPREQHVWRVPLGTGAGAPEALTTGGGVHGATVDHGVTVISSALRDGGSATTVVTADGSRHELPDVSERPALVPTTRLESVEIGGNTFYTAITRPRSFDSAQKYPVLVKVYGGPSAQMVLDYRDGYVLDQLYADAGFIVVRADNRGTPHRGRAWERAILKDLISVPLEDQAAVFEALASKYPELDRRRVGVFGWSFGGYLSCMAVLLKPDIFHAAIAGAPVTAWELYDTAYTERYMKEPKDNPEGYKHGSALTHAEGLRRPLLLMHGITDDNVHFAHTLAMIEALYRAGKRAEVVALASTHMLTDPKQNFAREKLQIDFFREKLGL